jgi:hypothetical protein
MTKKQEKINEREDAMASLKKLVRKGDTVYTLVKSVSSSGMSRTMKVFIAPKKGVIKDITYHVAQALEYRESDKGMIVGGCGMDMGFSVVYQLTGALGIKGEAHDGNCYGLNHYWL